MISSQRVSFPNSFFADGSLTVFPDILLNHNGVIKYVDFGAAKVIARQGKTLVAATGTHGKVNKSMTGTPMYMSPEVIQHRSGQPSADAFVRPAEPTRHRFLEEVLC